MNLEPFIKFQKQSKNPYMCINIDHLMPLVAMYNLDGKVELRCFVGHCDFKIKPGLYMWDEVCKETYDN